MRYLGILGLLIAVAIMLYLAAPRATEQATRTTTTYNAATRAAQHASGAAEQHVRDIMQPPVDGTNP
jgi:uncharacterized protein (UPF0333 family)